MTRQFLDTIPVRASLVAARDVGALEEIASFNYDEQFAQLAKVIVAEVKDESVAQSATQSAANATGDFISGGLLQIFDAVTQYQRDHDGVLPPLQTLAQAKTALKPYLKNDAPWLQMSAASLHPNPLLSGRKLAHVAPYASSMALFYTDPLPDGNRWVLLLDGSALQVSQSPWSLIKKASRLP